jgi:hypothetical protein
VRRDEFENVDGARVSQLVHGRRDLKDLLRRQRAVDVGASATAQHVTGSFGWVRKEAGGKFGKGYMHASVTDQRFV